MDDAKREELLYKTLGINPPTPPQPLDEAQITERVAAYRAGLEARWPACRDYLAGVAWPGLRFRIKNEARSFLNDVQVILTFHGARGVNFEDLEGFRIRQGSGPELAASGGPAVLYRTAGYAPAGPPSDYPIEWRHNDDGDLEVTVTLPQLRPHPEWRSDEYGDDIVVVVDPGLEADEIAVTYTATAHSYGDVFEGEQIALPVEKEPMLDVLRRVIAATRDDDS
ncbi:hypothetical protein MKUB_29200 [Mycobacterium kubicae]|uniref:Uncharacterized protein n=2 Tax=Mycobacterium kubicae TaxID=120959 RepID=A0ABQ1BNX6_9MYCO|nr:hypothetical protein MKUB_29200 [Mycobacterium kubicae]